MIGEVIGNFKIVSRIGRGGMGEVFLAEHTTIAENRVAVKILHADISRDREQVQRFFNEARAVSKIKHAGIVKIFDSGMFREHAYLIMELLEGESLATRLERGPLTTARLAAIGRQIASVLEATHRAGITHRDLKPDNIFLVRDEEVGERVKILDFGIAKLSGTLASSGPKTQGTMGTPSYMAPEQWGDSGQVDWRADAYSLGCVAYEMACGQPPFVAQNIAEAYARHLHAVPPPARALAPDLSEACEALIARLLAKQPEARAASMAEVIAAFEAIAAGAPVAERAPIPGPPPPTSPSIAVTTLGASARELTGFHAPPRRRSALALGLAAVAGLAMIVTIVVVATRGAHGEAPPRPIVAAPRAAPDAAPVATVELDAAAPVAPTTITVRVETEPAGAEIYRVTDSVRIGDTPFALAMPPGAGELVVLVKKAGYHDERVALPLVADVTRRVVLVPDRAGPLAKRPPPTTTTTTIPPDAPPAKPGRKKGDVSDNPYDQ